jgi:hypothetical protein
VELDGEIVLHAPTFRDLRHTLIAHGWDPVEVSVRLRRADTATTLRIYAHEWDALARSDERRSRLDRLYGNTMETTGRSGPENDRCSAPCRGPGFAGYNGRGVAA